MCCLQNLQENEITVSLSISQEKYTEKVQEARKAYNEDNSMAWSSTSRIYAVDMQKVLLLLIITGLKSCIFIPRLIVFNETFATTKEKEVKEGKIY